MGRRKTSQPPTNPRITVPHPNDLQLQRFVAAQLDAKQEKSIEEHLAQCPECLKRVSELERQPQDPLLQKVKEVAAMDNNAATDTNTFFEIEAHTVNVFIGGSVLGGNLRLEEKLGRGGMGEAWKASDLMAKRNVVVKLMPPEVRYAEVAMRQVRETFQKVHTLQHQHICPVIGLIDDPTDGIYVVMKFINGKTLDVYREDYIAQHGQFPFSETVRILWDVARALDYSHERKVLHRDVKPQNIMISPEDGTQLIDFGLAAEIRSSLMQVSEMPMDIVGTRPYMAPEQWRGRLQDAKTDQYALAVTAYELIAGHKPFQGEDIAVLRECVLNEAPEPIAGVPEHVNAALLKAMSKKREGRFPDCQSFIKELAAHLTRQPGDATKVMPPSVLTDPMPESPIRRINAWSLTLGSVTICAGLLGLLFFFFFSGSPTTEDLTGIPASAGVPVQFTAAEQVEIDQFCAEYGTDVKAADKEGQTLLHKAVERDKIAVAKFLISQGADVNARNNISSNTPFYEAIFHGRTEIAKFFASQGADVNVKNNWDGTPLYDAARLGQLEITKLLISKGANVHAEDLHGWTALHVAAREKHLEVVKFLVSEAGADIHAKTKDGKIALDIAKERGWSEIVHYLSNLESVTK